MARIGPEVPICVDFPIILGARRNLQPQCHMAQDASVKIRRSLPRLDCDGTAQTAEKPDAKGILKRLDFFARWWYLERS